ncbi:restriction endonuclease subunit S [Avibacterium avium]|uniref:restriction endonuclease subunit S n=1 Tax=Avibacterium avium TaxID=751 RepID=UPI003BF78BB5
MSEWKEYKLGEVATFYNGRAYKNSEFKTSGTPIVRIQNITGEGKTVYSDLILDDNKYINYDDLIYAWSATFGPYIWKGKKSIYHYHIWKIECDRKLIDKYFLYYKLLQISNDIRTIGGNGSIFSHITKSFMESYVINIPTLRIQKIIANTLKTLDQKIELNTQTNQILEQIAQGIFKHWFIDFAPVHAKANALARGETTEQAELATMACLSGKTVEKITALKTQDPTAYHQLQQTAAAFPSEFVETEMGEVPRGWEICSITDKRVCSIIKPKIHHFSGEKDYIATANVSQNTIVGELEKITFDNRPSRANMQPIIDSIWFAKMVGEHKAIMIDENDEFLLNNTILSTGFLGIKPQQYKKCFLYCFINSDKFTLLKNSLATGAVQIALNNTSFSSMHITLPNDNILEHFETKVSTLFSKIAASHRENKSLAETRELLLPKLLNGEIEL